MTLVTKETRLIDVNTGEYPLFLGGLNGRIPNTMFPASIDSEALVDFGLYPVLDSPQPAGDVVDEGNPVLDVETGLWKRTWIIRSFTDEEKETTLQLAKDNHLVQIEQLRINEFRQGVPYQFGDKIYHIQARDRDVGNVTARRVRAKEAVEAGVEININFRVFEDVNVPLTAQETVTMADIYMDKISAAYEIIWDLKDLTGLAENLSELPELPETIFSL